MTSNDGKFDYAKYYSELYTEEKYSQEMEQRDYPLRLRRFQTLIQLIKPKISDKILDVGTGRGELLELLTKKGITAYGIEVSKSRIDNMTQKQLNVRYGDAYTIPFPDKYFDCVVMSEVLEHLENPPLAIKEINRVLKRDGILAITVPIEKLQFTVCIHCGKNTPNSIGHLHQFNEQKLYDLLKFDFDDLLITKGINTYMISKTLSIPYTLWDLICKITPKRYSKYIVLGHKP